MLRNRTAERDIRDHLTRSGYVGRTAEFEELELAAIERPGWVQVFRFRVRARNERREWVELLGVLRDDERHTSVRVRLTTDPEEQEAVFREWSSGLITLNRSERGCFAWVLIALFIAALLLASFAAWRTPRSSAPSREVRPASESTALHQNGRSNAKCRASQTHQPLVLQRSVGQAFQPDAWNAAVSGHSVRLESLTYDHIAL